MRKNQKSNYLIIALICLIIFNIGSSIIQLNRNTSPVFKEENQDGPIKSFIKTSMKGLFEKIFTVEKNDYAMEDMEDFILIETLEEYEDFIKVKGAPGKHTLDDIPDPINVKKVKVNEEKPYIFLYHTHTTEGYEPFDQNSVYTTNNEKNVVKVGDTITKVLEARDHNIVHNITVHDRPSFNQSYSRSLNTLNQAMANEGNLKFFFDIHREGYDVGKIKQSGSYNKLMDKTRININDTDVATFFLVVGPNSPNFQEGLSFAKYIKAVSDSMYPGLCTGVMVKPYGKFNLYVSDYAALIEVGSNLNTIDESNESAKLIGEILDLAIQKMKE